MIRRGDRFETTKGPVNPARFWLQTSIRIEKALDEIGAAKSGGRANVLNLRATFEKQRDRVSAVPVQRFFQRSPTARAVDRCSTIKQQLCNRSIVNTACRN